jgi:chaperonin GroES
MNFKPLYDRVVVEPDQNNAVSTTGIVLPETSQERPQIGVVVEIGDGENFDGVEIITLSEEKRKDALFYAKDLKDRYTVLWLYDRLFRRYETEVRT